MYEARARDFGFASGEQARMKGTIETHAKCERVKGACITVSIIAEAMKGRQSRGKFFGFAFFNRRYPLKPMLSLFCYIACGCSFGRQIDWRPAPKDFCRR